MNKYLLGVDGGASTTRCLIADTKGTVISCGFGGCANKNITSWNAAILQVRMAIIEACSKGNIVPEQIVSAHFGLGGVSTHQSRQKWINALKERLPKATISVENDVFLAIPSALQQIGIAVVSGSGGNIGAITETQKFHLNGHVNFHSSQLGRKAVQVVLTEIQGQGKLSPFAKRFLSLSKLDSEKLRFAFRTRPRELAQEVSPLVVNLYQHRYPEAERILRNWLAVVSADIRDFQEKYELTHLPICLGGATFSSLRPLVEDCLRVKGKLIVAPLTLAEGALRVANNPYK